MLSGERVTCLRALTQSPKVVFSLVEYNTELSGPSQHMLPLLSVAFVKERSFLGGAEKTGMSFRKRPSEPSICGAVCAYCLVNDMNV